jgi:hypothetical protein
MTSPATNLDQGQYAYFLATYRRLDEDGLSEVKQRADALSDEAATALREVLKERSDPFQIPKPAVDAEPQSRELSPDERERETQSSKSLLNGPLAKQVVLLFGAQGLMLAAALGGSQGLRLGAFPIVAVAAVLMLLGRVVGRKVAHRVCASAEASIEEKTNSLRSLRLWLWPLFILSAAVGVALARLLGGA